jgi:hypothetical protein
MSENGVHLSWLADWYGRQVDGAWEHDYGVTIDTLDNPGWQLRIDLHGTALRDVPFASEESEEGEHWSRFWKDDQKLVFHAVGDPTTLPTLIARFRRWATENSSL